MNFSKEQLGDPSQEMNLSRAFKQIQEEKARKVVSGCCILLLFAAPGWAPEELHSQVKSSKKTTRLWLDWMLCASVQLFPLPGMQPDGNLTRLGDLKRSLHLMCTLQCVGSKRITAG